MSEWMGGWVVKMVGELNARFNDQSLILEEIIEIDDHIVQARQATFPACN